MAIEDETYATTTLPVCTVPLGSDENAEEFFRALPTSRGAKLRFPGSSPSVWPSANGFRTLSEAENSLRNDHLGKSLEDAKANYQKLEQSWALGKSPLCDVMVMIAGTFADWCAPLEHRRTMNRFVKTCIRWSLGIHGAFGIAVVYESAQIPENRLLVPQER